MLYEIIYNTKTKQAIIVSASLEEKEWLMKDRFYKVKEPSIGRFSCLLQTSSLEHAVSEAKKAFADYFENMAFNVKTAIDAAVSEKPIPIGYRAQIDFCSDEDFRNGLVCKKLFVEPLYDSPEYEKDIKPSIVKIDSERAVFVFPNDCTTKQHSSPEHAARDFFYKFLVSTYNRSKTARK